MVMPYRSLTSGYLAKHLREASSGNHAINQVVVRGDGSEGAERRFATNPETLAFVVGFGDADIGGAGVPQCGLYFEAKLFDLFV